jgi:hypothetical protein
VTSSVLQNPLQPAEWVYRVFFPHFDRAFDLHPHEFFATGTLDPTVVFPSCCEIQFDTKPANENDQILGAYRLATRDWNHFTFRKSDQVRATYRLNLPVTPRGARPSVLYYNVPRNDVLNRDYVLRAIAEIIGIDNQAPDGTS